MVVFPHHFFQSCSVESFFLHLCIVSQRSVATFESYFWLPKKPVWSTWKPLPKCLTQCLLHSLQIRAAYLGNMQMGKATQPQVSLLLAPGSLTQGSVPWEPGQGEIRSFSFPLWLLNTFSNRDRDSLLCGGGGALQPSPHQASSPLRTLLTQQIPASWEVTWRQRWAR